MWTPNKIVIRKDLEVRGLSVSSELVDHIASAMAEAYRRGGAK